MEETPAPPPFMTADEIVSAAVAAAAMITMRGIAFTDCDRAAFKLGFIEGVDWIWKHYLEKKP